jgi:hypothetical protein
MDWQTTVLLGALIAGVALAVVRIQRRLRGWAVLLLATPVALLVLRWAGYRGAWTELAAGAGIALAVLALWWALVGRRLPPPAEPPIRVLTDEDDP